MGFYHKNRSCNGKYRANKIEGIYTTNEKQTIPEGAGDATLTEVNSALSGYTQATAVSTVVGDIESLGYSVISVVGYGAKAEALSGTNTTLANYGFRYDLFDNATVQAPLAFSNSALNEHPTIFFCGMFGGTFYGTGAQVYWEYTGDTLLKNLWYPNQDRKLYWRVEDANGTVRESTNATTGTIFSDNQQPGVNGYNSTARFASDDGLWGFMDGIARADGNGGPYQTATTGNNHYGVRNANAGDTSDSLNFWNGTQVSDTAGKFYFFIKEVV